MVSVEMVRATLVVLVVALVGRLVARPHNRALDLAVLVFVAVTLQGHPVVPQEPAVVARVQPGKI